MTRIRWGRQSVEDLEAIRLFIARNAPHTADEFVSRLIRAVENHSQFPHSGGIVPEQTRQDIREIIHGNYRIIYRARDEDVVILTIRHAARLLSDESLI